MVNVWYVLTPSASASSASTRATEGYQRGEGRDCCRAPGRKTWGKHNKSNALQGLSAVDVPEPSATDTVFAWQVGAGVGYALSDVTTLQLGYRLQAVNGLEFTGRNAGASTDAETDLLIHFLEIGVRYRF